MYPYMIILLDEEGHVLFDAQTSCISGAMYSEELIFDDGLIDLYKSLGCHYMVIGTPIGDIVHHLWMSVCMCAENDEIVDNG